VWDKNFLSHRAQISGILNSRYQTQTLLEFVNTISLVQKAGGSCRYLRLILTNRTFSNINKNPTTCNSMQSDLFYCKITLHVSGVTVPIIRGTKNCNRSLRCRSYCEIQGLTGINYLLFTVRRTQHSGEKLK